MRWRIYYPVLATAALIVGLHLALAAAGATYYMTQITMSAYYALVVIGLCLLMGYAGQASLGHAGFFAIGGYAAAVLTTYNLAPYSRSRLVTLCQSLGLTVQWRDLYGSDFLSFTPWVAFAAALLLTGVVALVIGASVIRLKGHYLAMATLGFGLIVYRIALGTPVLGRADGVSNVPPFHLLDGLQVNGRSPFRVQNYYIARDRLVAKDDLALMRRERPGDQVEEGCLAGPVRTDHRLDRARRHVEAHVLHRVNAAEGTVQIPRR